MANDPPARLPLKPLVFHLLVALLDGDLHGWGLLRAAESQPGGEGLMPGQLYRQLDSMLAEGLIEERRAPARKAGRTDTPATSGAAPKRFFRLTPFGRAVAKAEARRLETLVGDSRVRRLLSRGRS